MFIQIIQGRCTRPDDLHAAIDRWHERFGDTAPGWLGGTYGFTDDDQFIGVVRFESEQAARANSERPEQGDWWRETEQLFDGPVEFHDCDRVALWLEGGSDRAGFVQIIRGRVDDPDRLQADLESMTSMVHQARPEIIGATLAFEPDGTFTETVSFTDESAAREGERREMPVTDEVRQAYQEWDRLTHEVTYTDLHHPWFASHR